VLRFSPAAFLHSQVLGAVDVAVFTFSEQEGCFVFGRSESCSVMLGEVDNGMDLDYVSLTATRR